MSLRPVALAAVPSAAVAARHIGTVDLTTDWPLSAWPGMLQDFFYKNFLASARPGGNPIPLLFGAGHPLESNVAIMNAALDYKGVPRDAQHPSSAQVNRKTSQAKFKWRRAMKVPSSLRVLHVYFLHAHHSSPLLPVCMHCMLLCSLACACACCFLG